MKSDLESKQTFQEAYLSPFRWAGSKRKSIRSLETFWRPEYKRYLEPFCGSASLFFRIQPAAAILSDLNSDLIHAFLLIRNQPEAISRVVGRYKKDEGTYYQLRSIPPGLLSDVERAARFIYLNRYCFNGLYRTNVAGQFNVPYGGDKSGAMPTLGDFLRFSAALSNVDLRCCDFQRTLEDARDGDFVYLDPPYHLQETRTFRQYDPTDFDFGAIWRLRNCIEELSARGIPFLLSYADSEEGRFLANGFRCRRLAVGRNIAGFASDRRKYTELLIYPKFACPGLSVRATLMTRRNAASQKVR